MVKGVNRRVIVVKSPDPRYFEEAIFIVRDDILKERGADSAAVLREARRIAAQCAGREKQWSTRLFKLPAPFFAAAGAAATGAAWLTARLCGL